MRGTEAVFFRGKYLYISHLQEPPTSSGPCRSRVAAFVFRPSSTYYRGEPQGACAEIIYGGCGATGNFFPDEKKCREGKEI